NPILMDPYLVADSGMGVAPTYRSDDPGYELLRKALGYALTYANRVDLKRMRPRPDLAGTGHCLASTGADAEFLVYLPKGDTVTVDLGASPGPFRVEWFSPTRNQVLAAPAVRGGSPVTLRAPFSGEAVLYLGGRQVQR
ncbi:MAG TPA: hypothetical protein VH113_11095, partial [Gemmatimonadales bacterium]|nr:hypothetical protein [Gemmatimonadales bacterium]